MHRAGILLSWIALLATGSVLRANAADPHIEKIERFGTNQHQVLIHFETPANRTTTLQFTESLRPPAAWTNLYVVPRAPIPNHFIILDTPTNGPRFYRLRITQ
jgi:hypothetical protein